jgi:predicted esterase
MLSVLADMKIKENTILTSRTARYYTIGEANQETTDVWIVCHGYGQLAKYFIKHFQVWDDGKTFVLAPEALSRFYLNELTGRIGASWMTKDDRENEIGDYISYLSKLYVMVLANVDSEMVRFIFLGFSQGATTTCRFVALAKPKISNLVLWAGSFPHDIDPESARSSFSKIPTQLVYGNEDQFLDHLNIEDYEKKLQALGISYEITTFEGKHEMNKDVLIKLGELVKTQAV